MEPPSILRKGLTILALKVPVKFHPKGDAESELTKCVVLISADPQVCEAVRQALPDWIILTTETLQAVEEFLESREIGVVLCDKDSLSPDWRAAVSSLSNLPHRACVIVLARTAGWNDLDEVIQAGGYEVLRAPYTPEQLLRAVKSAWSYWRSQRRLRMRRELSA